MSIFRVFICYVLLFTSSIGLYGQDVRLNELLNKLSVQQNDSVSFAICIELSDIYSRRQNDSAWIYLERAQNISERNKYKNAWAIMAMGDITRNKGNFYYYKSSFVEAIDYYSKAAQVYETLASHAKPAIARDARYAKAKLFVNMGVTYTTLGNFQEAMESYYNALRVYDLENDIDGMANCYLGIGNLHYYQQNLGEATTSLLKAEELYIKSANKRGLANCINTLGGIFYQSKDFDKAINYFGKLLELRIALNDQQGISTAYTNLANTYMEVGELEKSIDYLTKALEIDRKLGDSYGVAIVQINLARLYDKQATREGVPGNKRKQLFSKARDYAVEAFRVAEQMRALPLKNYIAEVLLNVNRSLENFDEARYYNEVYIRTRDSIQSEERTKAVAEIETLYQTERKQQEIDFLKAQRKRQYYLIFTVLIGFVAVLILSVFLYQLLLNRKKVNLLLASNQEQIMVQNRDLQHANEEILAQRDEIAAQRDMVVSQKEQLEAIHHQLTDSLRYAQSIQAAILPSPKNLQQISSDSFVIMNPCELVSGDFYWATTFNEFQIFCVADCTGHGVPGAFMSILGITALSDVVSRHRVTKPSEILGYLRESVIEALSQNDPTQQHKDGMDMAICTLNTRTHELQYAGAGIPLWIVAEDNEISAIHGYSQKLSRGGYNLFEIKNDIMPVGFSPLKKSFQNHSVNIAAKEILVYLSTDGYYDQFGSEGKFGVKRFHRLILDSCTKTLDQQKVELEREFERWKKGMYQIDDVTVLGIRLSGKQ